VVELLGLAVLELAAVTALALPPRLDPHYPWWRWHLETVRPPWIASVWRRLTLRRVRLAIGLALLAATIGWIGLRFSSDLPIVIAMALEVGGITVLAIEVFVGHEAERYEATMAEAREVASLYNEDKTEFVIRAMPLMPAAMEQMGLGARAGAGEKAATDDGAKGHPAKKPDQVTPTQVAMLNLVLVTTTAGFSAGNRNAVAGDVHSAAEIVHHWLGDLTAAANEWHDSRRDSAFATRRVRLFLGVLALALAAAVHAWHLQELHHLL
jgi:hypothetical protein